MRYALLLPVLVSLVHAQEQKTSEIQKAIAGSWVGTLEYRDYSEAAGSDKRVKLPTWLTVEQQGANLTFRYVYDDGPAKTVTETSLVELDTGAGTYSIIDSAGKVEESYKVEGLDKMKQGRGSLLLRGTGTENKAAVEVKTTLRIGRNILEIVRETAPSGQPLAFRHAYTFVRSAAPAVTPIH